MPKPIKRAPEEKKTFGARVVADKKTRGLKLCANCGAVYFSGHWHTAPAVKAMAGEASKKPTSVSGELCHECRFLVHGRDPKHPPFGGELTLDGLASAEDKEEILGTVRNAGAAAQKRDPMHHIIAIDDRKDRVIVTTTENHLAVAIGKAVDAAHKGGKLTVTFGNEDNMPSRVHWVHKP